VEVGLEAERGTTLGTHTHTERVGDHERRRVEQLADEGEESGEQRVGLVARLDFLELDAQIAATSMCEKLLMQMHIVNRHKRGHGQRGLLQ
jgi:hypothetical protein